MESDAHDTQMEAQTTSSWWGGVFDMTKVQESLTAAAETAQSMVNDAQTKLLDSAKEASDEIAKEQAALRAENARIQVKQNEPEFITFFLASY